MSKKSTKHTAPQHTTKPASELHVQVSREHLAVHPVVQTGWLTVGLGLATLALAFGSEPLG